MTGRPVKIRADVEAIQKLMKYNNGILELKPLIAFVMRKSDCTYAEIGEVLGVTRKRAQIIVKTFEESL